MGKSSILPINNAYISDALANLDLLILRVSGLPDTHTGYAKGSI